MKFILDSCAFIDIAIGAPTLSSELISIYRDTESDLFLSIASVWELGLKRSIGKLDFDINGAVGLLSKNGIGLLDITLPVVLLVNELPYHHKDPFDRVIIATAKINDMAIVTSDDFFSAYGVETIDSRT